MGRKIINLALYKKSLDHKSKKYRRKFLKSANNSETSEILLFDGIQVERYDMHANEQDLHLALLEEISNRA